MFNTACNFWLSNDAYILHLPGETREILLHDPCGCEMIPPVGEQLSYQTLLLPSLTILILSCALHSSLLPLCPHPVSFSSPFFFSPIHYQEGQPVEAPVSPTPSQQGLEAVSAATVSPLTPTEPMFV